VEVVYNESSTNDLMFGGLGEVLAGEWVLLKSTLLRNLEHSSIVDVQVATTKE
jgi:hypothetical protein